MNPTAAIICGDILDISDRELAGRQFDAVVSLSCVDWNVQFADMLTVAWSHVRPGGHLISTFRLTNERGCNDIATSYQFISADDSLAGERAAYVVLNARALVEQLLAFRPAAIIASGYWGVPSGTAITPYGQLCFAAFAIQRRIDGDGPTNIKLDLPGEITEAMTISGPDCVSK